ncbi:ABC transporter substrate-binding protein [Brevibacillus centrosporus]|uniref:SgrR family transcriptional regulator n=1 Tax=Brevibacillus centrosporus TaxID=54910 RepID=UPI00116A4C86|nr:SgrR family transcriptional regulator [Brevibacillus centrosporus]MEC2128761.1 ABC transporter substrate-binding protein [Brevibacillus centrosporus]GED30511.1 peptide-binding protein [Brevibacillus centrosporus]
MQIAYHYLRLRQHFAHVGEGVRQEVTLSELAAIFYCTVRNAKLVVKQLVELQWLGWIPGRGRGNVSQVIFLRTKEQIVLPLAQAYVQHGDMEKAMQLLLEWSVSARARERFLDWLSGQFGFLTEEEGDRTRDTLRMSFYRTIPALDPAYVGRVTESHMVKQIFDTLIRYDEEKGIFLPHIAHHWEANDDGTEWTLYLRKGVLFHHGRELTADDIVWTLERIGNPSTGSPYEWMLQDVSQIAAIRDTIVKISLSRPNQLLLSYLASDRLSIVPREVVEERGERFAREPVGTGPFTLVENSDQMFILEAFPAYFLGRAHLDRVEIWIVPEPNSIEGEVHLVQQMPDRYERKDKWQELQRLEKGCKYMAFNLRRDGPQQNPAFREVIHRLLDREKMIREVGGKRYQPASGFIQEWQNEPHLPGPVRPDEARELLAAAGYQGETVMLYTYKGAGNEQDAEWLEHHLQAMGICVKTIVVPIVELQKEETLLQADVILVGKVFDNQLLMGLVEMYKSDRGFMRLIWDESMRETIDQEMDKLMRESEPWRQQEALMQVEERLKERFVVLFLYHSLQQSSHHSALAGVSLNAWGFVDYKDIWFKP